jgi:hypothetical protein
MDEQEAACSDHGDPGPGSHEGQDEVTTVAPEVVEELVKEGGAPQTKPILVREHSSGT